jgi:5-methyltetrahydropteroyltriglutamate--homocysteine methyltransferase
LSGADKRIAGPPQYGLKVKINGRDVLLPTTMVGSWPRPLWLRGSVLRESVNDLDYVDAYQRTLYEDAVRLCVKDQDLAGLDVVTDGNQYFQGETPYDKIQMLLVPLRLEGFRPYGPPGLVQGMEHYFRPIVSEKIRWVRPIFGAALEAMKSATDKPIKININSGPAFVATWCDDQYYGDAVALRADVAGAFNLELHWLADHGASVIQLTEQTYLNSNGREDWTVRMMERAARGVNAHLTWHMCYGNAREIDCLYPEVDARCLKGLLKRDEASAWTEIHMETARPKMAEIDVLSDWTAGDGKYLGIGVVEVMNPHVETPDEVADRICTALAHVPAEQLIVSTDCGLYQLTRDVAFRKLCSLVKGTQRVRQELGRRPDGTA